ncbi:MAG: type II toxin-antitoxin system VapC family toxin [Actinomycetota bacterium]|nr:type II toxin-antitoxin system VapC family toxin [Actinomycetota bacterium]
MFSTGCGGREQPLRIGHSHALAVANLPDHHRDPFDRLLIAQSQVLSVPLVTADDELAAYDIEAIRV